MKALARPTSPHKDCGGVHRDQVSPHLETARIALTARPACRRPGGLGQLVGPEITDEVLEGQRALDPRHEPP
ncbi:hypothetical protein [Streptomyces poonensis]|uniref:Uncharacterized protein n=1 Tax=Streptomyces poonensis TaxID=68255 RepID=A0A918UG61_9ACTN|nr:hypothetical protein [Streptomyces poonensis]GGZ03451.1 hypothetical protein GCM10010365_22820 [Streptomyces poonensis]GLJ90721.1 hypothetical protein GCM10017589_33260 [Streptomyces poonensis]